MRIELNKILKKIKNQEILKDISYVFEGGKIYGIMGHNGSGKTMLLRAISGLINIDHGYIKIDEKVLHKDIDFPESLGIIIENPSFFSYYTGFENLKFLSNIKKKATDEDIKRSLEKVGLDVNDKRTVSKYSLGMKQKLAIAQAIMEEPKMLFLDEPINALDDESIKKFKKIINDEKKKGACILIATHNKALLEDDINEYIYLNDGKMKEV